MARFQRPIRRRNIPQHIMDAMRHQLPGGQQMYPPQMGQMQQMDPRLPVNPYGQQMPYPQGTMPDFASISAGLQKTAPGPEANTGLVGPYQPRRRRPYQPPVQNRYNTAYGSRGMVKK